jgi:hypothetical protein
MRPGDADREAKVKMPKRSMKGAYDDVEPMRRRRWIPEKFKM